MNRDLTQGRPDTVLWRFCLPLFGSVVFQQLYNIADSFVAGKFVGENALAAVGNSYEITLIYLAFAFGCNIGCSVIVSQLFGASRLGEMKTAVTTTMISSGVVCLFLMIVGLTFSDKLLQLINTPQEIIQSSKLYLQIYTLGLPFVFYYNISTGVFSALGDSRTPFFFLMCSSLSNIAADIFFTTKLSTVFTQGVDGVAWATFICQGISCILAVIVVFRRLKRIKTDKYQLFSWQLLRKIAAIALPSTLQQCFISVGNIMIQGVINSFGTGIIAGYSASVKLNNLVITAFTTLGNGISNFTAQNIGAQKPDRVKAGYTSGLKLVWLLCLPVAAVYFFAGSYLIKIFLDIPSPEALHSGVSFLRILSPFYFIISAKLVSDGILRGAGMMKQFMAATFTDLILRVVLAEILSKTFFGITGVWLSWPVGWCVGTVMSFLFYRNGRWNC